MELKFDDKSKRPLCVHCTEENVERPEIGILFSDLDGRGSKPVCWQHYKKRVYNLSKESEDNRIAVLSSSTGREIYYEMKEKEKNKK